MDRVVFADERFSLARDLAEPLAFFVVLQV
jgi:hypothetical protein